MANRLKKMLTEEMVRLDPPLLSTPEEADRILWEYSCRK